MPLILKEVGVNVYTFDFNNALEPDFCGDVANITEVLPEDFKVDVILCCEVLEHLPYENFEPMLNQLNNIVRKKVRTRPNRQRR